MCKHCCENSRNIIEKINSKPNKSYTMYHVSGIAVRIDGDNLKVKALDTDTYFEIESKTKINFCPMCGQELKH